MQQEVQGLLGEGADIEEKGGSIECTPLHIAVILGAEKTGPHVVGALVSKDVGARLALYRGTSLIRNAHPPRITMGPGHRATVGS